MSFRSRPLHQRARSPSVSSSSTADDDEPHFPSRLPTARPQRSDNMEREQDRRAFSQSTPSLGHHRGVAGSGTDENHNASQEANPHRNFRHVAVASHFMAQPPDVYGGQTWVDFLRESGPPSDSHHRASPGFTLPTHPTRSTEHFSAARGPERKRRLTTPESPMRRPSNSRTVTGTGSGSGSSADPIVLDPTPSRPPPPTSFPSQSSLGRSTRRESEGSIVLPTWQPDSDVSHCPVCGSQFTFFYRKHHCRYSISC